jgi:hypothetical protein
LGKTLLATAEIETGPSPEAAGGTEGLKPAKDGFLVNAEDSSVESFLESVVAVEVVAAVVFAEKSPEVVLGREPEAEPEKENPDFLGLESSSESSSVVTAVAETDLEGAVIEATDLAEGTAAAAVAGAAVVGLESAEDAPDKNLDVAALTGLGLTSFHSTSDIPSGFLGSPGAAEVVGLAAGAAEAPDKNLDVAALTGLGLTSFHSASDIPSGFLGSPVVEAAAVAAVVGLEVALDNVAVLTGLESTLPSGFLGSLTVAVVVVEVAGVEAEGLAVAGAEVDPPDKNLDVAALTGLGLTSFHSASDIPSGFLGSLEALVAAVEGVSEGLAAGAEAPDKNLDVAALTGLGLTSFHSASDIPSGFLGSPGAEVDVEAVGLVAGAELPDKNLEVAALTGLGLTSFHSASDIPSGFFGSPGAAGVEVAAGVLEVGLKGRNFGASAPGAEAVEVAAAALAFAAAGTGMTNEGLGAAAVVVEELGAGLSTPLSLMDSVFVGSSSVSESLAFFTAVDTRVLDAEDEAAVAGVAAVAKSPVEGFATRDDVMETLPMRCFFL